MCGFGELNLVCELRQASLIDLLVEGGRHWVHSDGHVQTDTQYWRTFILYAIHTIRFLTTPLGYNKPLEVRGALEPDKATGSGIYTAGIIVLDAPES